jgi:hypothetical protein
MRGALVVTILSLAIIFPSQAQQTSSSPAATSVRDPQALSLITQSLSAMGALASPNRMTHAQGTISYPDGTSNSISIQTIGTDHLRQDVGANDFSFVSNSGDGFLLSRGKKSRLQYWIAAYKRPEHLPALSLMAEYQNPNLQIRYVDIEDVAGSPAHHLRLSMLPTDKSDPELEDLMSEFHVWIDQSSLLVVKTRHFDFSPEAIQNRTPVDILFTDYRQQDGAKVPFRLTRFIGNDKHCEIVFSTISLTATVSTASFE